MRQNITQKVLYWGAVVVLMAMGIMFAFREPPNPALEKARGLQRTLASMSGGVSQAKRERVIAELIRVLDQVDTESRRQILTAVFQDLESRDVQQSAETRSPFKRHRRSRMEIAARYESSRSMSEHQRPRTQTDPWGPTSATSASSEAAEESNVPRSNGLNGP